MNGRIVCAAVAWVMTLLAAPSWCQIAVAPPAVSPAAITAGSPTTVTVSALVTSSGRQVLENGVNLLQVDENGNNPRVIAVLNDLGVNGDTLAGDNIFGGRVILNPAGPGEIYLQVSAAFRGLLRRTLSPITPILVTTSGFPNSPRLMDLSRTTTDPATGGTIICDELLLTLQPGVSPASMDSIVAPIDGTLAGILPALGVYQVTVPTCDADSLHGARTTLATNPLVSAVAFDGVLNIAQLTGNPDDLYFLQGKQWDLTKIQAPPAWSLLQSSTVARGATIGILDTGVNGSHEDLLGHVLPGLNWCAAVDSVGKCNSLDTNANDDYGHGTAVAGLAAASTNNGLGVASPSYGAFVIPEKITKPGTGQSTDATIAYAIYDAVFRGAKVINLSSSGLLPSFAELKAIQYAYKRNVLVVASGGNLLEPNMSYPAANTTMPNVIAVGASGANDHLSVWRASDGSFCNAQEPGSNYGPWITLYAPGSEMFLLQYNNDTGYGYFPAWNPLSVINPPDPSCSGGTSYAAPLVAGAASLLLAANGNLPPVQLKTILSCTADIIGTDATGSLMRRLNLFKAVQAAAAQQVYGDAAVYAPKGQVICGFPEQLILDTAPTVVSSYLINYSPTTVQYSALWDSSKSVTSLYDTYKQYLPANGWTITNDSGASTLRGFYATSASSQISIVIAPLKNAAGASIIVSYLAQ